MANAVRAVRPMMQWMRLQHRCFSHSTLSYLLCSHSVLPSETSFRRFPRTAVTTSHRSIHFRSRGTKLHKSLAASDAGDSDGDKTDPNEKPSRNQKKREARRAVKWGMELASFSTPLIKRILRVTSLEPEVFDAIMLAKRLGRDVKEGKRRQFSYIGRLLREVEPELMDGLIEAAKDGDQKKFEALYGSETWAMRDDDEVEETYNEHEKEGSDYYIDIATKWFDRLRRTNDGGNGIEKEIYSAIHCSSLEKKEFTKLLNEFRSLEERMYTAGDNEKRVEVEAEISVAEESLERFLQKLAKQAAAEQNLDTDHLSIDP